MTTMTYSDVIHVMTVLEAAAIERQKIADKAYLTDDVTAYYAESARAIRSVREALHGMAADFLDNRSAVVTCTDTTFHTLT